MLLAIQHNIHSNKGHRF